MSKPLSEMTAEEFCYLFPIVFSEPHNKWKDAFTEEKYIIEKAIKRDILRIEHIGSTAIFGIKAKPSIDILVEIKDTTNLENVIKRMRKNGYTYAYKPFNPSPHMMFTKGYRIDGVSGRIVHLHIRYLGDWDEVYFRDYLNTHQEIAKEYESLKIELAIKYKNNRRDYRNGKSEFVCNILDKAKKENEAQNN